jgi:hypothetical protein
VGIWSEFLVTQEQARIARRGGRLASGLPSTPRRYPKDATASRRQIGKAFTRRRRSISTQTVGKRRELHSCGDDGGHAPRASLWDWSRPLRFPAGVPAYRLAGAGASGGHGWGGMISFVNRHPHHARSRYSRLSSAFSLPSRSRLPSRACIDAVDPHLTEAFPHTSVAGGRLKCRVIMPAVAGRPGERPG